MECAAECCQSVNTWVPIMNIYRQSTGTYPIYGCSSKCFAFDTNERDDDSDVEGYDVYTVWGDLLRR